MSKLRNTRNDEHSVAVELEPIMASPRNLMNILPARSRTGRDLDVAITDAETVNIPINPSAAPRARPEFEEDDEENNENDGSDKLPVPKNNDGGIDDGFLTGNDNETGFDNNPGSNLPPPNGLIPRRRPSLNPFPFAPDFDPNVTSIGAPSGVDTPIPDVNIYQHKKTLAQGMMDLALLSANANQLRYVLESYNRHPYYYTSLTFISISIIFQIAVGIGLILNSRYNVKNEKDMCRANKINNFTVVGIFIVTTVNVFISAFGVANPPPDMNG
ncbi:ninjurin-A-like [Condylostylus longicornis]|uniref:ninjurin-A-like n=1 Tax=Condylostylus longicornis TaxID=2530218 RepID=UPI00244E1CA9|nr:ninjurin-A-like [Condylostylus longicornis]XP_055372299.1 ninjurin-A-like [Condylostylus longicornis]XP_055372300.1 ninjurin-A-like [Condylostylus longicornis]XP_055372301.1 ninjurin-A-like [Condylostylus longicornis]XP_055372302.1 ninjurin-A-like [Condylostylus longicornis]